MDDLKKLKELAGVGEKPTTQLNEEQKLIQELAGITPSTGKTMKVDEEEMEIEDEQSSYTHREKPGDPNTYVSMNAIDAQEKMRSERENEPGYEEADGLMSPLGDMMESVDGFDGSEEVDERLGDQVDNHEFGDDDTFNVINVLINDAEDEVKTAVAKSRKTQQPMKNLVGELSQLARRKMGNVGNVDWKEVASTIYDDYKDEGGSLELTASQEMRRMVDSIEKSMLGDSNDEELEEDSVASKNNGYGEHRYYGHSHTNDDENGFPSGQTRTSAKKQGPAGARSGNNPENTRNYADSEHDDIHESLVHGYRSFLEESENEAEEHYCPSVSYLKSKIKEHANMLRVALTERASVEGDNESLAAAIDKLEAAKRGLQIVGKLPPGEERAKHTQRIMVNLNKIRGLVSRLEKVTDKKKPQRT